MPRIDPIQLLNCLSVLLSPDGGIKSRDEVQRLAKLMTKFSKKLVSKCIYIQILKCTETELLGLFMGSGGWRLVHMWLTESIVAKNWPLVRELLELLLLCPVDIERLKTNNCPKLVKELSKDGNHLDIRALASKLVEQWLKTVKGEQVSPVLAPEIYQIISDSQSRLSPESEKFEVTFDKEVAGEESNFILSEKPSEVETTASDAIKLNEESKEPETLPVLKITVKDGKQILSQVDENEIISPNKGRIKSKSKDKSHDRSTSSSRSSSKHSSRSHSSSAKHKSDRRSNSPSRYSSKDRSKEKSSISNSKSRDKESNDSKKSNDRSKSSSSSSSRSKEERTSKTKSDKDKSKDDKNKESTQKLFIDKIADKNSVQKLGKIPKLSDVKKEKPSISIEVRKPEDPKPKTVKTFHSKFRKHGLEEEIKPPPSRASLLSKKAPPVLPPTVSIPKRPSPVHNDHPPEKKPKTMDIVEKPGSIKLIPPKPKPTMLLESDMFMDALNASATVKKEPKKRKRRTSGSKDGNTPGDISPPHTPTTPSALSPNSEKSVPPRFYQDTLETEEDKEKSENTPDDPNESISDKEIVDKINSEPHTLTVNGLKGVLCYHKKKGPKKSIKWKPDSELEEVQYFELDETERVNVTKTFTDMKYLDRINEREAFEKARNLSTDDVMEEKTSWRALIPLDIEGQIHVEYGKNSKEKDIQTMRQKGTLQALYFHKSIIPDSPHEPELETHTYSEPNIIPLEDVTGNQDNISDFRTMPWPEPKGNPPPVISNVNMPPMFPPNMAQFPNSFPNPQFPGVPGLPPNMMPPDWQNGVPSMLPNGMPGVMPPNAIVTGAMPPGNMPGMMVPPESMMIEMFGAPNPMFGMPPDGFNMPQGMFPPDFNLNGPQGPTGPDGFPGVGNFRGVMRGRGVGGHWRGKTGGNWDGPARGRGGNSRGSGSGRKAVCIYFQRKGSCRQGDNCTFLHPGVNFPF